MSVDDVRRRIADRLTGDHEREALLEEAMDYCARELRKVLAPPSEAEVCRTFAEAVGDATGNPCTARIDGDVMTVTMTPREFTTTVNVTTGPDLDTLGEAYGAKR